MPSTNPGSLADIMDQLASQGSAGMDGGYGGGASLSPGAQEALGALRKAAFEPDPEEPPPVKIGVGQRIGLGLANALNAYARAYGAGTNTDYLRETMAAMEGQRGEKVRRGKEGAARKREAARFQYGEVASGIRAKVDAEARAKEKAEEAAWRRTQVEQANADRGAARQQAKEMNDADNATRIAVEKMGNEARARSDGLQAYLHRMRSVGEADTAQHAEYAKSRQFVIGKKAEYAKMLAEGAATPEQILAEWQDTLDASDLSGKYREAADAFFKDKIGTLLMQYGPQQTPEQAPAGPVPSYAQPIGQALLQRAP